MSEINHCKIDFISTFSVIISIRSSSAVCSRKGGGHRWAVIQSRHLKAQQVLSKHWGEAVSVLNCITPVRAQTVSQQTSQSKVHSPSEHLPLAGVYWCFLRQALLITLLMWIYAGKHKLVMLNLTYQHIWWKWKFLVKLFFTFQFLQFKWFSVKLSFLCKCMITEHCLYFIQCSNLRTHTHTLTHYYLAI